MLLVHSSENLPEAFDQDHLAHLTCSSVCCKGLSRELWSLRDSLCIKKRQPVPHQDKRLLCGKKMRPNVNTAKPAILGQARDSHSCQLNTASYYKKYKKKRTYCGGWPHNTGFPLNIEAEISVISYPQPNGIRSRARDAVADDFRLLNIGSVL